MAPGQVAAAGGTAIIPVPVPCRHQFADAATAAFDERRATAQAKRIADAHEVVLANLARVADPVERLLRMASYVRTTPLYLYSKFAFLQGERFGRLGDDLQRVCSDLAGRPPLAYLDPETRIDRPAPDPVPWASGRVAAWFADRSGQTGLRPPSILELARSAAALPWRTRYTVDERLPCWVFPLGATQRAKSTIVDRPGGVAETAYITTDGRALRVAKTGSVHDRRLGSVTVFQLAIEETGLNLHALAAMARVLGLDG